MRRACIDGRQDSSSVSGKHHPLSFATSGYWTVVITPTLHFPHPLQTSSVLERHQNKVRGGWAASNLVEKFDDKEYLNDLLRKRPISHCQKLGLWARKQDVASFIAKSDLPFPIVGKPIRGRGSHGVRVCQTPDILHQHIVKLLKESPIVMLEAISCWRGGYYNSYASITRKDWLLGHAIVIRFGHADNVAPYNGVVGCYFKFPSHYWKRSWTDNSYGTAAQQCETVARLISATAPIRVDIRRFANDAHSPFALFDINLKPVSNLSSVISSVWHALLDLEYDGTWSSRAWRSSESYGYGGCGVGMGLCNASSESIKHCTIT